MKFINSVYNKWVKRKCPHLCLTCKYKDSCDYEFRLSESKYLKGFDDGYEAAEANYKILLERAKKQEYQRGFYDAANEL